jgi:hypothetical protein
MSRNSCLSAILSCADRPNALAISRLPAGWSEGLDELEDLLAGGEAGSVLHDFGHLTSNPLMLRSG